MPHRRQPQRYGEVEQTVTNETACPSASKRQNKTNDGCPEQARKEKADQQAPHRGRPQMRHAEARQGS